MTSDKIVEVLSEWNLWTGKGNPGIARDSYVSRMVGFAKTGKVVSVVGIRRGGKSTLVRQMAARLVAGGLPASSTLIVNFEEPAFENTDLKGLTGIYKAYREIVHREGKPFVFLDEVQNVPRWERFVRCLQEKDEAYLIVTGSSSKLLSPELGTLLTGRCLPIEVLPLSFAEFLRFGGIAVRDRRDIAVQSDALRRRFREYLAVGGFPEAVLAGEEDLRKRILLSYYEDIVNRDLVRRFKVKNVAQLKTLMNYFMTNAASHMSFNRIARFLHQPIETVRRFSHYGETSELVFFVARHAPSIKLRENSTRKVYAIDHGLRDRVAMRGAQDLGHKAENIAALALRSLTAERPGTGIHYWKDARTQREADFVVTQDGRAAEAIQVCWDPSAHDTRMRELDSLAFAVRETGAHGGLVLSADEEGEAQAKGKSFPIVPLWKWLLEGSLGR